MLIYGDPLHDVRDVHDDVNDGGGHDDLRDGDPHDVHHDGSNGHRDDLHHANRGEYPLPLLNHSCYKARQVP